MKTSKHPSKYLRFSIGSEEAIRIAESGEWKSWSHEDRALKQLLTDELMMPFGEFHSSVEKLLDRPVWTHEFVSMESLLDEYYGKTPKANRNTIIQKLIDLIDGRPVLTVNLD